MNSSRFLLCLCSVVFYLGGVFGTVDEEKTKLRQKMMAILKNKTAEERVYESSMVMLKLHHLPSFRTSERIGVYLNTEYEVHTEKVIKTILGLGKRCFVPRRNGTNIDMVILRSMDDYASLKVNELGFKEPSRYDRRINALEKGSMDILIIPGLAFNLKGDRLGRGRGTYDKYIASIRPKHNPCLIGLAYEDQILKTIPRDDEDIKVDIVMHINYETKY